MTDKDGFRTTSANNSTVTSEFHIGNKELETPIKSTRGPSKCREIFSWRVLIYLLLHVSVIVFGMARVTCNMVFVCINTQRRDIIRNANISGISSTNDLWLIDEKEDKVNENEAGNNSSIVLRNSSMWDSYENVLQDINWDSSTWGLILSGPLFLAGVSAILSDVIRQQIGSRALLTVALIIVGTVMLASPEMARMSPHLLLVNQLIFGLFLETQIPVLGDMLAKWTPIAQKLTASFIVFSGYNVGGIINTLGNGFFCSIPVDNGWPFIFYIPGGLVLVHAAAWFVLARDCPERHPFISADEKEYILASRSQTLKKKRDRPPYAIIMTSVPVLSFLYCTCAHLWTSLVTFISLPVYLNTGLDFSARETGMVFSVFVFGRFLGSLVWTLIGNVLTDRKMLSSAATRKLCLCTGTGAASVLTLIVSFIDHNRRWTAIGLIAGAQFLQAVASSHLSMVAQDMAPRYAGTLLSLGSSVGHVVTLSGPLLVSALTSEGLYEEWRIVWLILAGVFLSSSLVFLVLGSANPQPWANPTGVRLLGDKRDLPDRGTVHDEKRDNNN